MIYPTICFLKKKTSCNIDQKCLDGISANVVKRIEQMPKIVQKIPRENFSFRDYNSFKTGNRFATIETIFEMIKIEMELLQWGL